MRCDSILQAVGNTPLVELTRLMGAEDCRATILAKVESANPGGSGKDRVALSMIRRAEAEGRLLPGGTIVESTSGNTGVGLAMAGAVLGYRVVLTMPETMSLERRMLLSAYGAQVVLTPGAAGMAGANAEAERICRETPNSILASQFANPDNPAAHEETTGPEILRDTDGRIDAFVACIGTGGTLTGTGRYLKAHCPGILIYGVEPKESPLLTEGWSGAHGIQGIGANFVPEVLDQKLLSGVQTVSTQSAMEMARTLAKTEGILSGISSGAAVFAALQLGKQLDFADKTIVTLLPDTGERYLSSGLFERT